MNSRLRLLLLLLPLLAGCSHYRLGTGGEPSFSSVFIQPVLVKALIPQSRAVFTTQLRDSFIRDGRLTVTATPDAAEIDLLIVIRTYLREVATVRPGDTGLARKFNVTVTADATLRERRDGRILFERRPLIAKRELFTDSGQTQAEYQLLPLLAADIAEQARHAVLDVW